MDTTPPQGAAMGQTESSKLPPVLAKLMDNLSTSSYRSPPTPNAVNNPVAPAVNVQELLSSIMVNTHRTWSSLVVAGWACFSLQICLSSWEGAGNIPHTWEHPQQNPANAFLTLRCGCDGCVIIKVELVHRGNPTLKCPGVSGNPWCQIHIKVGAT